MEALSDNFLGMIAIILIFGLPVIAVIMVSLIMAMDLSIHHQAIAMEIAQANVQLRVHHRVLVLVR